MPLSRWPLFGLIAAGSLAAGSCAGALVGQYTITGGLYPNVGWDVPSFGSEAHAAELPAAAAVARVEQAPQYAGYYPAQAPMASSPDAGAAAARDYDALFDEAPRYTVARHDRVEPDADDWPPPSAPSADVEAYSAAEPEADVDALD